MARLRGTRRGGGAAPAVLGRARKDGLEKRGHPVLPRLHELFRGISAPGGRRVPRAGDPSGAGGPLGSAGRGDQGKSAGPDAGDEDPASVQEQLASLRGDAGGASPSRGRRGLGSHADRLRPVRPRKMVQGRRLVRGRRELQPQLLQQLRDPTHAAGSAGRGSRRIGGMEKTQAGRDGAGKAFRLPRGASHLPGRDLSPPRTLPLLPVRRVSGPRADGLERRPRTLPHPSGRPVRSDGGAPSDAGPSLHVRRGRLAPDRRLRLPARHGGELHQHGIPLPLLRRLPPARTAGLRAVLVPAGRALDLRPPLERGESALRARDIKNALPPTDVFHPF